MGGNGWGEIAFLQGLIAALAVTGGLILLIRGWRGRRVGQEPHCGKCGYNLSGASGNRCSECGASLDERTIVAGVRQRRTGALIAGTVILLIGMAVGTPVARRAYNSVDWYRHYPLSWLQNKLQSGDTKALIEMARRFRDGQLTDDEREQIFAALLTRHRQQPPPGGVYLLSEILARLARDRKLSDDQLNRYLTGLFNVTLSVSPQVRAGQPMTLEVSCEANVGNAMMGLTYVHEVDRITIGGLPLETRRTEHPITKLIGAPARGSRNISFNVPADAELGLGVIVYEAREGLYEQPVFSNPDPEARWWSRPIRVERVIEILPVDAAPAVDWVDDPALRGELLAAFGGVFVAKSFRPDPDRFGIAPEWHKHARPLPVAVAFDVILRIGDVEHNAGAWAFDEAGRVCVNYGPLLSIPDATEGELILRGNLAVAEQSACGLTRIWKGELNLGTIALPAGEGGGG